MHDIIHVGNKNVCIEEIESRLQEIKELGDRDG